MAKERLSLVHNILLALLLTLLGGGLTSCDTEESIKIGMIAGLTGRVADLGRSGRDGVVFAVEERNSRGGIAGKSVKLIVGDDKQNEQTCLKLLDTFIDEKVVGIIGPMTSSMGLVVAPVVTENLIPTISPTVATDQLSEMDDFFFRIMPVATNAAMKTAQHIHDEGEHRRVLVLYDTRNSAFTIPWLNVLKDRFMGLGGERVEAIGYRSANGFDFYKLVQTISQKSHDCIVILASAMDTAMICQQLQKLKFNGRIYASEWSATDDILQYGGRSVEGVEIFHSFDRNSDSIAFRDFQTNFRNRFGYTPGFGSVYSYLAAQILFDALEKESNPENIKRRIIEDSPFEGMQQRIQFDQYGDAKREYTLLRISEGRIISL